MMGSEQFGNTNLYRDQAEVIAGIEASEVELFTREVITVIADAEQADEQLASLTTAGTYRLNPGIRQVIKQHIEESMSRRNNRLYSEGFGRYLGDGNNKAADDMVDNLIKATDPSIQFGLMSSFVTRAKNSNLTDNSRYNMDRFPVDSQTTVFDAAEQWLRLTDQVCHDPKLSSEIDPYAEVFWRLGSQRNGSGQFWQELYDHKMEQMYESRNNALSEENNRVVDNIDSVFAFAHHQIEALDDFRGVRATSDKEAIHVRLASLHDVRPSHKSSERIILAAGVTAVAFGTVASPAVAYAATSPLNLPGVGDKTSISISLPTFEIKSDSRTAKAGLNIGEETQMILDVPAGILPTDKSATHPLGTANLSLDVSVEAVTSDKTIVNDPAKVKHAKRTELDDIAASLEAITSSVGPERAAEEIAKNASVTSVPLDRKNPALSSQLRDDVLEYQQTLSKTSIKQPGHGEVVLARFYAALENPASLSDISDEEYTMLMDAYGADFAPLMETRQKTIINRYDNVQYDKWEGIDAEGRSKLAAMLAYMELNGAPRQEIQLKLDEITAREASKIEAEVKAKAEEDAAVDGQKLKYKKTSPKQSAKDVRKVYENTIRDRVHDLVGQVESVPGSMFDPVDADWLTDEILKADKTYPHDPLITPEFVIAQLFQESKFDPDVGSNMGARGIAQFIEGTATQYGLHDRTDPSASIKAYYKMMDEMVKQARINYPGQDPLVIALASYNAGPGAVAKYGGVPNYKETKDYVENIGKITEKTKGRVEDARQEHKKELRKKEKQQVKADAKVQKQDQKPDNKPDKKDQDDCAPGSKSLGIVATSEHPGGTEVCAILDLPSSGEESTPGSNYYVVGAEGKSIVEAQFSKNLVDLVDAAQKDGVTLRANSSLRTNEHQQALWLQLGQNRNVVAPPGHSMHEKGNAIDFSMRNGISQQFCVWNSGICEQPGDPAWDWLSKNAPSFGFYQYSQEYWHFDPTHH